MTIFTGNSNHKTIDRLLSDEGERIIAALRWERIKDNTKRVVLYQANAPELSADEIKYILNLEELYVNIYSEWEKDNITNEQYKVLQEYLPPEYFINVIAIYICTRFYELPAVISEIKAGSFELSEADQRYFNNYLRVMYKPSIEEFIEKCKELRPRTEVYNELVQFMVEILDQNKQKIECSESEKERVTNLMLQLNEGMSLLISCLNNGRGSELDISEVFEDLAPTLEAHVISKRKAGAAADTPINVEKVFKTSSIEFPLDKVNKKIWGLCDMIPSDGTEITFGMESRADKRKGREVDLTYSIDFTALEESESVRITKKLTPFDKRVYTAVGALYNAGNTVISLSQIYTAMGNTGKPPKSTLDKINDSITKMLRAVISISNDPEAKVYNYPRFVYDGNLLPIERISNVNINGKTTEAAIHILREPPMISFAKKHGNQLTTVPIKVLQSPISKTDNNLQIEEYLIERIAKAKKGSLSNKILISSIYEDANITDTKQKQRLPEKLIRYLDHYKKENFIKGYSMSPNSVTIDI